MSRSRRDIVLCSGARHFGSTLKSENIIPIEVRSFSCNEFMVCIESDKALSDIIYVVQSFGYDNTSDLLMELLLTINSLRNSGYEVITAVIPYMPYSRQDRILQNHGSFGMEVIANILSNAANRVITFDIHNEQSLGLFSIPISNIAACTIMPNIFMNDKVIIFPDKGSFERNKSLYKEAVCIDKKRNCDNIEMLINGDVNGKACLIIDDIIDTGRTMCHAANLLKNCGAKSVEVMATHAIFSEATSILLSNSCIERFIVSNSVANKHFPRDTKVIDISGILSL